jgi:hypothetical protein
MASASRTHLPASLPAAGPGPASAVEIVKPGGYDVLRVLECPGTVGANLLDGSTACTSPAAARSDLVTVDVAFSGVNYADVCIRWGLYASAKLFVPGCVYVLLVVSGWSLCDACV